MKVFLTGATGLIGSAALRALVKAGHEVTGLTSRAGNARQIEQAGAAAVVGDMRDAAAYANVAREAEAIIHAAAAFPDKIRYGKADVDAFMDADADAVEALISVVGPSCRAFVFSSGAYVYGDTGPAPVDETFGTERHHAVMTKKLETENRVLALARAGKLPAMVARAGLVYGHGSLWAKVYLDAMKRGRRAMMPGDGSNIVSFVHADDCGEGYRIIAERGEPGNVYNIADDAPAPVVDVARAQARAFGAPPPRAVPAWLVRLAAGPYSGPPPLAHNALQNGKLRALGWAPKYPTYDEGVVSLADETSSIPRRPTGSQTPRGPSSWAG